MTCLWEGLHKAQMLTEHPRQTRRARVAPGPPHARPPHGLCPPRGTSQHLPPGSGPEGFLNALPRSNTSKQKPPKSLALCVACQTHARPQKGSLSFLLPRSREAVRERIRRISNLREPGHRAGSGASWRGPGRGQERLSPGGEPSPGPRQLPHGPNPRTPYQ